MKLVYKCHPISFTLQGKITYPTKREVRKIIDSKVPAGMRYVSYRRRVEVCTINIQSCHGQEQHTCIFHLLSPCSAPSFVWQRQDEFQSQWCTWRFWQKKIREKSDWLNGWYGWWKKSGQPIDMVKIPFCTGFDTAQVVQDVFHQQYPRHPNTMTGPCMVILSPMNNGAWFGSVSYPRHPNTESEKVWFFDPPKKHNLIETPNSPPVRNFCLDVGFVDQNSTWNSRESSIPLLNDSDCVQSRRKLFPRHQLSLDP